MSLLHSLHRNVKTIAMPMGMVVGALLCRPVTAAESMSNGMITPTLIFLMLFFTFCRVKPRQMRVKMLHVWLLAFQIVGSIVVYLSFVWFDPLLAQGAMICVLAPVAMAAVVIGGMLGANVTTMATYSLICNMVVALVAPMLLSFVGSDHATFLAILSRVGPVLVLPFVCAQLCRNSCREWHSGCRSIARFHFICGWCRWFLSLAARPLLSSTWRMLNPGPKLHWGSLRW